MGTAPDFRLPVALFRQRVNPSIVTTPVTGEA